jgi:hypothetical protein
MRAFSATPKHHLHTSASLGEGSLLLGRGGMPASAAPGASSSSSRSVYERWTPANNGGLQYSSPPLRNVYGDSEASKSFASMLYPSPRPANKFEFTYPSTSYGASPSASSPHHRHLNYSSVTSTPSLTRRTSTEHHALPHHVAYQGPIL